MLFELACNLKGRPCRIALLLESLGVRFPSRPHQKVQHVCSNRSEELSLARTRRLRKQSLERLARLGASLLLKFAYPVGDGSDHVACRLLRALTLCLDGFGGLFLPVSLVALDYLDRGLLSHDCLFSYLNNCLAVSLFTNFPRQSSLFVDSPAATPRGCLLLLAIRRP